MENTTYELRPLLAEIRDGFRGMRAIRAAGKAAERENARAARSARKSLQRELSSYSSPRDLTDLEALLGRHGDEETAEIRRLLGQHRSA